MPKEKNGYLFFWVFVLIGFIFGPVAQAKSLTASTEEVLFVYPVQNYKFDFEGTGKSDNCSIICKKVKDFSSDPAVKEKKIWYQFRIKISSGAGKSLFEDLYSTEENDFKQTFERFGLGPFDPGKYLRNYFNILKRYGGSDYVNGFAKSKIDKNEIDKDGILEDIKKRKINTTVEKVVEELSMGNHMTVEYVGEWAEDVRIFVYSRELKWPVRLLNAYEMNE